MFPAGDEYDVLASLRQPSAEIAAHATSAKNSDTHDKPPRQLEFLRLPKSLRFRKSPHCSVILWEVQCYKRWILLPLTALLQCIFRPSGIGRSRPGIDHGIEFTNGLGFQTLAAIGCAEIIVGSGLMAEAQKAFTGFLQYACQRGDGVVSCTPLH